MYSKNLKKRVGLLVLCSQLSSALLPLTAFAAPQSAQASDIQNSLETVGTKANRLKTVGSSGVDESTGAFTYSYPFSLTKGLNGLEPSISLSYNSQATENSIAGFGWNMAIPYIERSAKFGVDKIYTKNDFVSSLGGELVLKNGTSNEYIQKIDDGSYQIYTLTNNVFTLRDRSGNTYYFGQTLDSRLCDNTCSKIQKYYLTEVRDIMGNKIKYFYEKKNGFVYPKEIIYTIKKDGTYSNKIVFEREARADEEVSYKSGFRVEMKERIKNVKVYNSNFDNNFTEVAKLELAYTTGQNGTRSLLSTIKESRLGTDGLWSTIPETKFEYEKGTNLSFQSGGLETIYITNLYNGATDNPQTYVDLNGDGKVEQTAVKVHFDNSATTFSFIDVNGDYLTDKITQAFTFLNNGYPYQVVGDDYLKNTGDGNFTKILRSSLGIPKGENFDVNGDGLQDIISGTTISLNSSEKFTNASYTLPTSILGYGDFNGDGLVDIVKDYASTTNASSSGKYVFLHNGYGWNTLPEFNYKINVSFDLKTANGTSVDAGVRFEDLNGDGLADLLKSWISDQTRNSNEITCLTNNYCFAIDYVPAGSFNELHVNTGNGFTKKTDVNFGGNFAVAYNRGTTFNQYWPGGIHGSGFVRTTSVKNFIDNNYDGTTDFGAASSFKKQDILKTVVSPLGAKSEIIYKGSVNQNNPKLPINILTVSEIKNTEVKKNLVETVKYSYENGKMYFDKNNVYDRRFAGFQKVTTETGSGTNTKKVVKYFHQGDGDDPATFERGDSFHNIGRVYKEEVYGGTAKYAETYRTYGVYNWDGQIYKYPKLEVVSEFDKSGNSFSKASTYDYDLASRLPKKTENFGEVKWDITTGIFSDIGEDYILTKNIYNTKRPQKLLAEESFDINGKFLDKKLYFYDELPFGYVEKGLLSEERNYSSANNYIKTNYTYNLQGLIETKTDNNGAVTKFVYDANYNPITVTNALNQSVNSEYNKILGVATKTTNANGKISETVYDGFGTVKSISQTSPKDDTIKVVATKNISYSGSGMTETENIFSEGVAYKTSTKNYDSFGRLVKSQNTNTENSNQTIDVVYNNFGQIEKVTYPYDSNNILSGYFSSYDTKYIYDELGRNISVSQGDLTNFTDYILNGKITRDNTTEQHKKEYKYNSLGKLSSVKEYTNSANSYDTKYEWNVLGNLTKLTDAAGNVRNFQYDSEGRLLKQEDLHAPTDNTFGVYTYIYNNNGNLVSKKDPSDQIATYEYDILNRPQKESFGVVTDYVYDTCQNGVGNLCEITNANYSQKLKYTKAGNLFSESKFIADENDGKTFIQMYEYNDLGQNTKIVLPDASYISYAYDVNGKQKTANVTRMLESNGNVIASTTQIIADAKYNIDGTVKNITSGNNVKTCYEYSGTNGGNILPRLSKINVINNSNNSDSNNSDCNNFTNSNLLFGQELKYNLFGSIVEEKQIFGANNFNSGTLNEVVNKYEYDILQRLTKSDRLENNLNVVNNLSYNSIGNILSSDGAQYSYTGADYQNPHAPSIIGDTVMSYDLNGNILSDGKNQYEWNVKNTLKKVVNEKSVSEYTYDVSGERIKEVVKSKSINSTSTFALNTGTENYVGEEVFTNFADLGTTSTANLFMSKTAYDEIKVVLGVATVTKQDITNLLLPIQSTKFISETCATIVLGQKEICERDNVLKVIYSKYKKEKNLDISYGTLEEIWLVYKNKLKIDGEVYLNKKIEKSLSYLDPNFKFYFAQQNYISDYAGQPWCTVYENPNNNYVCNFIFTKDLISKSENYDIQNAWFTFVSQNSIGASTTKVSNILNIDLASSTKFATSSSQDFSYATASGTTKVYNYNLYKADISKILNAWTNSTSSHIGFSIRNQPVVASNQYYNIFGPSTAHWGEELLPKIIIEYKFNGEFKSFNSTSTKVISSENLDSYYNSFITNTKVQEIKKVTEIYISENSYLELEKNKLNSQNKVEALFALAIEGNKYVKDTCMLAVNVTDANCSKKEAIKFVASYLYTKHNIKLSANTLEEMYKVYLGDLKIARSADVYEKKLIGSILSEKSAATCSISFPQYRNDYVNNNCNMYYYFYEMFNSAKNKFDFDVDKQSAYFEVEASAETGKTFIPFKYTLGTKIVNIDKPGKYKIDFSTEWRNQVKSNTYIWSNYWNLVPVPQFVVNDASNQNKGTVINKIKVYAGQYEYINKINSNVTSAIGDVELNSKVYGSIDTADKNLLGAIYKQKKLASLFGSEKLISKETFTEISTLPFTYSDLIIKDMLVEASFAPYTTCENIFNDLQKRNCRKEIFVKYLFAIVKYETDKELSAAALDELFEVSEGNLSIPNNTEDYYLYDIKRLASVNFVNQTLIYTAQYSPSISTIGGCNVGYYQGSMSGSGMTAYSSCMPTFTIPQEVKNNSGDLFKVEIENLNIPKTLTDLKIYLNVGMPTWTTQYPTVSDFSKGVNTENFVSVSNYAESSGATIDITPAMKNWIQGNASGNGLRFTSNVQVTTPPSGQNAFTSTSQLGFPVSDVSTLKYTFRKNAAQNEREYLTPLVVNPKDSKVYEDVLRVLARIDKDYKSGPNTIISADTFAEIKNTNIITLENLIKLFEENEKLQKDDTLASVWQKIKTDYNQELTREALEELYMVWKGQLSLPQEANQYNFTVATTSKQTYDKSFWTFFTENASGVRTNNSCSPSSGIYCYLKIVPDLKTYTDILTARLVFENATVGYGATISLRPLLATPTASTTLSNTSNLLLPEVNFTSPNNTTLSTNIEAILINYQTGNYENNGFRISSNYGVSLSNLQNQTNTNNYVEYNIRPNFTVFDKKTLSNLSEVPGVFSLRTLADADILTTKMYVSTSSKATLKLAGVEKKEDILQFTTTIPNFVANSTTTIKKENKIDALIKINSEIKRIKNISLTRESLEEIYYILNGKLIINPLDNVASGPTEISGVVSKYEMNGTIGSADKKKDTMRPDKPIFQEGNISATLGRKSDSNNAYQFSGSFLKYPAITPKLSNQARTVSLWMKSNTGGTQTLYSFSSGSSRNFFAIWHNGGKIVTEVAWTGYGLEQASNKSVGDNIWHKVDVVIQNNPNANVKIFIDGVLDKDYTHTSPYNMSNLRDEAIIGAFQMYDAGGGLYHYYSGALDEVKVYDKALTNTEIKTAYDNDMGNATIISENLTVFEKSNFGILEPIEGVVSELEINKTENINYTISSSEIKNISKETVGELSLVGITTKQQIVDVFNLSKTTEKDSKISFFKEYFEIQKQYTFSREALEEIYLVYTDKSLINSTTASVNERENYGELSQVSTEEKLDANYVEEINSKTFNVGTTSTSTVWKTSSIALSELASSSITTVQQIKDLFNNASTTNFGKDAKLYYAYKTIKDTKNISLSRLTLEEMWKISLDEQLLQGAITVSTTQTVTALPTSLSSEMNYKMNGTVGSVDKKKDEVRSDKPIFREVNTVVSNGRTNDTNGAYQFNSGYLKLPNHTPAITTNPQTYSLWYKGTGGETLINLTSKGTRNFMAVWFYQGKLLPEIGWTNGGGYVALIGNKVVTDNVWHKIDLVVENINNKAVLKLYIDGELDMDSRNQPHNNNTPLNLSNISNEINLGATENYYTGQMQSGMQGSVDDFKLYNKSLTPEEIRKEYQIDKGIIQPVITQTVINSVNTLEAFNRDRFKELEYISPISLLEKVYNITTGLTPPEPFTPSMPEDNPDQISTLLTPTLNTTLTPTNTNQIQVSPETLLLLNPLNYPYTIISPSELSLQINQVNYTVNLDNYLQFYTDLETNNINTLAKYLNKVNNLSEEIQYTKYYPFPNYEYDTRGVVTISVPFNGKIVATIKYSNTENTNLQEISFVHNSYNATPVLLTDSNASTSEIIKSDVWGTQLANTFDTSKQVPTDFGLTGHKYSYESENIYAHARWMSPKSKIWLSHDPFSIESFTDQRWLLNPQSQNSYAYANQNPVNMVDPDGKMSIAVPGTWYQEDSWNTTSNPLFMNMMKNYNEIPVVINDKKMWSGKDQMKARVEAAKNIADMINSHKFEPGEKLNLACHSHGGTVCKMVSGMINRPIDELTTLGTPFLPDVRIDKKNVKNYTEVYSNLDWTQLFAGTTASFSMLGGFAAGGAGGGAVGGPAGAAFGMLGGTVLGTWLNWGEMGLAKSRQDPDANKSYNATLQTSASFNPATAHGQLWSVSSIWTGSKK